MFYDDEDFWEKQVKLTRDFLRRVVWCAIEHSSKNHNRPQDWNGVHGRTHLNKEASIDAALAYFVFKQENGGRTTSVLADHQLFHANRAALAAKADLHFTRTLYPQHVHTKMDYLVQVHELVCLPIISWEGSPNYPLMYDPP